MKKKKTQEPLPQNIAYSLDWRGQDDELPVFVFIGATYELLCRVFHWIIGGGYIAKGFKIEREHACIMRNGKHYWRWAVELKEWNMMFCSRQDLCTLIESRIMAEGKNRATFFENYNKFLNT
jgi:hypothetical protein